MKKDKKMNVEEEIGRRARKVSREDVADVLEKEGKAKTIVEKAGFLSQYWEDIKTSFALIRDWFNGSYDKVPARMIASLTGALIYLKDEAYREDWKRWLAAHPNYPREHTHAIVADVCRPEWLFEIESDATQWK